MNYLNFIIIYLHFASDQLHPSSNWLNYGRLGFQGRFVGNDARIIATISMATNQNDQADPTVTLQKF